MMFIRSNFAYGMTFNALLVFCMTSAHGMHRQDRDPRHSADKPRSTPPLPPRPPAASSSASSSAAPAAGPSRPLKHAPRTDPDPVCVGVPYTPRPIPLMTKEEMRGILLAEGREVKAEVLALMAEAERKRKRASSAASSSISASASPSASRAPDAQTPDFSHLRRRKEMCRAGYSILHFLGQDHRYTLPHTRSIIAGAPFGADWSFRRSERDLETTFRDLPEDLQNRFALIWANAQEDLAAAGGTLPDLFPLEGRAQAAYYDLLLEAFDRVGLKDAAAALMPRDLPDDPRQITSLNKALERLYRYGLTPDERGRVIRKFQRGIRRLQKK